MSKNLTELQIIQYNDMVQAEFQSCGFLLKDTFQTKRNVVGAQMRFNKVGQGVASEKASQDDVSLMNPDYNKVFAILKAWEASDLTDVFDATDVNFDELVILSKVAGMAIGRRSDQVSIDALEASATTNVIAEGATNFTYAKFLAVNRLLNKSGVPKRNGKRFIAISAEAEESLLKDDKFINSRYVNNNVLNATGLDEQNIMGYKFIVIPDMNEGGLTKTGDIRTCYAWHEFAAGLATGKEISSSVDWIPMKKSWLTSSDFKEGAIAIDDKGIVKINIDETK